MWQASVNAQQYSSATSDGVSYLMKVKDATIENLNGVVAVRILFDALQDIPSRQSVVLIPELVDTARGKRAELPAIYLNSRNQQIYYERNLRTKQPDVLSLRKKNNKPLTVDYLRTIPYEGWMENSVLRLRKESCSCNIHNDRGEDFLCRFKEEKVIREFRLYPAYKVPKAEEVKIRNEKGSAYLCFVVDKTDIRPDYMSNPTELAKIRTSINLVKNDPNVEIKELTISGYASPEGNLAHNIELSQGRTESLKARIERSGIIKGVSIKAQSLGENWEGFREYLNTHSDVPQRSQLLAIMNESIDVDAKEKKMKSEAAEGFRYCLRNCFPGLRRTDYNISYVVRPFTLEESEEIFKTRPTNLSLNEIYRLADKYKNDEDKYYEIMTRAYALFPDDEAANLTMAYLALKRKDADDAEKYLRMVNGGPEKTLNEGIIAYLRGDVERAKLLVKKAADTGLRDAQLQWNEFKEMK